MMSIMQEDEQWSLAKMMIHDGGSNVKHKDWSTVFRGK